ncbi:MAG: molybdopterin molybdotransferase MoeA [Rhodocyclaceae bacterium]
MLSFEEAGARLQGAATPTPLERVPIYAATGRVLAHDLEADMDVPPADNSAMDGYAVRAADVPAAGIRLPVSQRVPAGSVPSALRPGTAARIFTGAPIPPGADTVVMQERCRTEGNDVIFEEGVRVGVNVRRAGSDIARGDVVLPAGRKLSAADVGLAASLGQPSLIVHARLRVAVFFTGDELTEPGEPLKPGAIYNSNRYMLRGLLESMGCLVEDFGIVRDNVDATREALRTASRSTDVVITCGGVSVGEEDHVKAAVEAEGRLESWKVAIKPGKPFAFGSVGQAVFIGLPGNPVSSFVTFFTLVRPYLRRRQGVIEAPHIPLTLRADFEWKRADTRLEFLRVRRNAHGGLDLYPSQGSGVLTSCAWADGFVSNAPGSTIARGDMVTYLPFEE